MKLLPSSGQLLYGGRCIPANTSGGRPDWTNPEAEIMAHGVCTRDFFHLEDFPLIMKSGLPFSWGKRGGKGLGSRGQG